MSSKLNIEWPLPPGEAAALAVSGGADSFALLAFAVEAGHPVIALTVDHGLREGSAAEAAAVKAWCQARGVLHETLAWTGEKPTSGIQEKAREARYRLLIEACYRHGIKHLVTAHTADDQAETVFMRLRRGAGRGLAGMPAQRGVAAGPGEVIQLHRPMLSVRRMGARGYAEEKDLPFVDDPSNDDERYERVRVRALLAALEQQDLLTVEALAELSKETAWRRDIYQDGSTGTARLFADNMMSVDGSYLVYFGDTGDGYWREQFEAVAAAIGALGSHRMSAKNMYEEYGWDLPATISGVTLARTPVGNDVRLFREPAALLGRSDGTPGFAPIPAPPGSKHHYDRRFIIDVPPDAPPNLELRPLGQLLPRDIVTSTLARQRISTLPCLSEGNELKFLPEQTVEAVTSALSGWKGCDGFLSPLLGTFSARSLLAERFAGDVIRY